MTEYRLKKFLKKFYLLIKTKKRFIFLSSKQFLMSSKEDEDLLKNEFINIHFDSIEKPTRLLIHTNQLSMVSNELVNKVLEKKKKKKKTND